MRSTIALFQVRNRQEARTAGRSFQPDDCPLLPIGTFSWGIGLRPLMIPEEARHLMNEPDSDHCIGSSGHHRDKQGEC
jgi:hypothetical protein